MKFILISDNGRHHKKITLNKLSFSIIILSISLLIPSLFGYFKNRNKRDSISLPEIRMLNKFDTILLKTAELESEVKRLKSLGKILAAKSNIDIQAYLLSKVPATGGLNANTNGNGRSSVITQVSLMKSISDLELDLELQDQRYEVLRLHQNSNIASESSLLKTSVNSNEFADYITPVSKGYVSSPYGNRRDPFNGYKRHHNGIDIAGKHGSDIHAIGSGFVVFSGRKGGYGNVIDIHHSDSLKSRYAHLDKIKVKKGEVVRKGDTIATMGKTGRATGPHLHLEVRDDDKVVNPEKYIDTALLR